MVLTTPGTGDGLFWLFALIYLVVICIVLIPTHVMNALPLFFIARRRGLKYAWLAWVPIGSSFVLGNISDHYQLMNLDNLKNRRIWLPLLTGATVLLCACMPVLSVGHVEMDLPYFTIALRIVVIAAAGISIVGAVIKWMATYDLFRSCQPYKAGTYLVICLGIRFLIPTLAIIREILMLAVCQKDLGMPHLAQPKQDLGMPYPAQQRKEPWDI